MYLLDTGIVLELRKARAPGADQGLAAWAAGIARQRLFLSALSLLEIETAAARLARKDKSAGLAVRDWIDNQVTPAFEGRVLAVDARVVRRRAQLPYANTRDGLLAATALEHGLTFVTHRVTAFRAGRVKLLNPSGFVAQTGDEDEDWGQGTQTSHLWLKNLYVRA
ncbi:PIN domain-containing protein [Roseateles sp.]|uniref:PIN domain-containing protein n=1 Tax=Roseateles sp. TaxID=1971397 RepID=UPI003951287E